jgi:Big-like domain-containing protein
MTPQIVEKIERETVIELTRVHPRKPDTFSAVIAFFLVALTGCGGSGSSISTPPPPPPPTPQSLSVTAPGNSLLVGDQVQLTAMLTYSDNTTQNVTGNATWGTSTAAVATVSNLGVLTAVSAGSVTLTATYNSLSGNAQAFVSLGLVTPGLSGFSWESVNTQGMGYVTGLVVHPLAPNDIYIRTDVGGAYRFDRTNQYWIPLLDQYGILQSEIYGIASVAPDPTNINTVYIAAALGRTITGSSVFSPAEVLVSTDRGATWGATGLAAQGLYIGANDDYRGTTGERVAVDPNQPSVVYFATQQNGLWQGTASATPPLMNWSQVGGGLPASPPAPGVSFILFDTSAGVTSSGATRNLYAGVYGSGVWASVDGGITWSQISPLANPARAAVATDGTLFVTFGGDEGGTTGSVSRYKAGTWTDITPFANGLSYSGVSSDPTNAAVVMVAVNSSMQIFRSTDQGNTWSAIVVGSFSYQPNYYLAGATGWGNAALAIDPANPNRVWQTNGYGVIETENITAASTIWLWQMTNLEELVVQKIKVPPVATVPGTSIPGADLFSVVADMVGFRYASRDIVPLVPIASFPYVAQGTGITYCASQPENAAFVGWDETNSSTPMSGITSNNGLTWNPIPNTNPGTAGKIAMASDNPANMVWAPYNATPQYTIDAGTTWQLALYNGAPLPASWQLTNEWWTGDVLAPDLVAPGTFYYFDNGNFYYSSNGGATWTLGNTTWPQDPQWVINVSIVANPATAGDVWMAFDPDTNQPWTYQLLHSTDGGKTFSPITTLASANYVAFGKGATPSTPYLYVHGQVPGATADAIYKSEDLGVTWIQVSDPTLMQFGLIDALEGDMRTQDLVYVGNGGRGIFFGYGPASGITQSRPQRRQRPALGQSPQR